MSSPTRAYDTKGNLRHEEWCENDLLHRIDDPAFLYWDENGNLIKEEWWINGIQLTDQQITVIKRKQKFDIINSL